MATGSSNQAIYWTCADVLLLAARLASSPELPAPAELRTRIIGALDRMVMEGRAVGISDTDIAEARYALVAFIDERILRSNWPGRAEWMNQPLQLLLYGEYAAGENFFVRMRSLLEHGGHPMALEIYYLCLALGFRGAYDDPASAIPQSFLDSARQFFARSMPVDAGKLSPHAIPRDRAEVERRTRGLLLRVLAASFVVIAITLVGLQWSLHGAVAEAARTLSGAAR